MDSKEKNKKHTINSIKNMKGIEKICALTAYDYSMAKIINDQNIEIILVGDSLSNTVQGNNTTLEVSLDEIIYHTKCVSNAVDNSLIIADLPFGTYESSIELGVTSAIRIIKEGKANGVKIEKGIQNIETIKKIIDCGIPVMGHIGLMPQQINEIGSYKLFGKYKKEEEKIINEAILLEQIGCFAIVIEKTTSVVAEKITNILKIPTIGIGAGNKTDGQILVINDMLTIDSSFSPKYIRRYVNLEKIISGAVKSYITDVKKSNFPNKDEIYI